MKPYDLIIVGASAAGMTAAIQAARLHPGAEILLLERLERVGKKLLATGNGRCNLSNLAAEQHPYHNAAFAQHALQKYDVAATLRFFRSLGLLTAADATGRLYPMSNTAAGVLDALRLGLQTAGVNLLCATPVTDVHFEQELFLLNGTYAAKKLILATGGRAAPAQGSDGSGYALLQQLGHSVTPTMPSLVPLRTEPDAVKALKGLRVHQAAVRVLHRGKIVAESSGEILFTDYGLSGIAAMEVSRAVALHAPCTLSLDLVPELDKAQLSALLRGYKEANPGVALEYLLCGLLPKHVGLAVCKAAGISDFSAGLSSLRPVQLDAVTQSVKQFLLKAAGTRGYPQAQVTAGGAEVGEFDPQSLQSRLHKGLYCAGELLDVDGGCGGFNLQWAWSSGLLAGELL